MQNRRFTVVAIVSMLVLALSLFGDLLFAGGTRVPGHRGGDLFLQYFAWRQFGFGELAKGNLALWNPHIFSGAPYFGGMQGAQLYPPNWLFLILPTAAAVTWTTALHVWGIGCFMLVWLRQRGLAIAPAFFGGVIVMFCGAFFPHIFAGHLPQLCAMTWAPLIFACIDGLFRTQRLTWVLLGIVAVTMQLLAGFPQYVFYTGIIAALYAALRLRQNWSWRLAVALLGIGIGGALLAAVQLLPGIQTTTETTRGLRLPYEFASAVALPPENFITLLAPNFFGPLESYWGRWYLWETSLFIGAAGVVFATYCLVRCGWQAKWIPVVVVVVSLVLALGLYTPLFKLLYSWVPGFDRFRSISKFGFLASLFVVLIAATGFDRLLDQKRIERGFIIAVFLGAVVLVLAGWWVTNTSSWGALMNTRRASGQTFLFPQLYESAEFVAKSQHSAATSLFVAGGSCALIGFILLIAVRKPRALIAIIGVTVVEMLVFALANRATFDSATIVNAEQKRFLDEHPGDYRIIDVTNPNAAMITGANDLWGYDATVVRRYAEFMTWTQGADPNNAMSYVKFVQFDPLFAMLRQGYVFAQRGGKLEMAEAPVAPLPHLQLISNYRVVEARDAIFESLHAPAFDLRREVILESQPQPAPTTGEPQGQVKIVGSTTDSLTIEGDVEQPAILLITDSYTKSWRAVSLPGSVQSNYQLIPANYILQAVPLASGHHRLRVEYAPSSFAIGKWISIIALLALVGGTIWDRRHRLMAAR